MQIHDTAFIAPGAVVLGDVTIGHGAIVHGCKIGKNCIIGAGALVTQNVEIPDNSLVVGNPGKVKRAVTEEEIRWNLENARIYVEEAQKELSDSYRQNTNEILKAKNLRYITDNDIIFPVSRFTEVVYEICKCK